MNIPGTSEGNQAGGDTKSYRGEVVYIYAFDLAYDMTRERVEKVLGQTTQDYSIGLGKRSPRSLFFYRPQVATLPTIRRASPYGAVELKPSVKIFRVGAISIKLRVSFELERIEDLVNYHELKLEGGSLIKEVEELAEGIRKELEAYCIRPVGQLKEPEAYTVFCISKLPEMVEKEGFRAEDWLMKNRRKVAGLLTREEDAANLSEQEAAESTGQYLSYYYSDLVVADWDAALVIGEQDDLENVLHIMELANVQLVELAAYDRILDESLQQAYRDVKTGPASIRRQVQRNLREIRVDLARLSDELVNTTKFFSDWHLAKIYGNLSSRFHLSDWHSVIDEKLGTLGNLYHLLQQDRVNFWMVVLEATIVLLFILDVILLVAGL